MLEVELKKQLNGFCLNVSFKTEQNMLGLLGASGTSGGALSELASSINTLMARLGGPLGLSNPQLAPHLEFVDLGGHGYAKVRLTGDEMRTEFVCIPRPLERSATDDGGAPEGTARHSGHGRKPRCHPGRCPRSPRGERGPGGHPAQGRVSGHRRSRPPLRRAAPLHRR